MAGNMQAIVMPKLGLSMTEGMVAEWRVKSGDRVAPGDVIADIETSKITNELQVHSAGVIRGDPAEEGIDLPVGSLLCVLADETATEQEVAGFIAAFKPLDAESMEVTGDEADGDIQRPQQGQDEAGAADGSKQAHAGAPTGPASLRGGEADAQAPATRIARKLAERFGISLAEITPTGARGRVTKEDVEKAIAARSPAAAQPAAQSTATSSSGEAYNEISLTPMRQAIAKRLTESKQSAPHFRLTVEANVERMLSLRSDLARSMEDGKISINDLLIKASAAALIKSPAVNIQFDGKTIRRYARAHVAVAVALEEGLLTPIIRNADQKSIMEISVEMKKLTQRARSGTLRPDEFEGGTFTLSNLGMFGIKAFDAIINPPQAAILAVGAAKKRRLPTEGGVLTATMMTATLSCDHRVIDGATGARFMQTFKDLVEHPYQLLI